jgi:hypothetical protein
MMSTKSIKLRGNKLVMLSSKETQKTGASKAKI